MLCLRSTIRQAAPDTFAFHKVLRRHYSGEVGEFRIFSGFCTAKSIKTGSFFAMVITGQVDGRPPVLTATSQSNGNGQTLTTHRIQTP